MKQAIILGGCFEFIGSLLGGGVASTISTGLIEESILVQLDADGTLYAYILFCTMFGALAWLITATLLSLPVSTTHALVGSLIGVSTMVLSSDGVKWSAIARLGEPRSVLNVHLHPRQYAALRTSQFRPGFFHRSWAAVSPLPCIGLCIEPFSKARCPSVLYSA